MEVAVAVSDSYVYWLSSSTGAAGNRSSDLLQVFDIKPANPQRVGACDSGGSAQGVAVSGHYAYVTGSWEEDGSGLQVIDISDPSDPRRVGGYSYDARGFAQHVAVLGNYAYVAAYSDLEVIDISNPANPHWVGGYAISGYAQGVAVSGHYAYVTDQDAGLQVLDVSDPANPQWVGGYDPPWVEGNDPSGWAPQGVAVSGNYAYVVYTTWTRTAWEIIDGWLEIIDISDPAKPRRVGGCDTGELGAGVAVSGNYAYVAGTLTGLQVIDVSDPANPKRVGGNSSISGRDLAVAGDKVYVAAGDAGLVILNAYQPPPRIESAEFVDDGFQLVFRGEAGRTIWLQRSLDLKTWEDWVILTASGDSQAVVDPNAGSHSCQFYRAVGQ
jgi:hypothetical protein